MNTKRTVGLTLLATAALAAAQTPGAPPTVDPLTPAAIPELAPSSPAPPGVLPAPVRPPNDEPPAAEPAAGEPVPAPASGAGRPNPENPDTPAKPRRAQNSLPGPFPVPVSPWPDEDRASRRNSYLSSAASGSTPAPARPRDRADQIIRDTKLKVLQSHYETALSELMTSERALIDATDDMRPAMETRLKGLRGFVEKLEADIHKLGTGPAVHEHGRMGGGAGSNPWKFRISADSQPPADIPELPNDPQPAPYPPRDAAGGATNGIPAGGAPKAAPVPEPRSR